MAVGFIPLDKAYLTAIWLETLFYGINLCLFSSYVYILRFRRARKISPIIFWVAVSMFCFSTAHVALGFYRLIRGFIELRDAPGGPGAYFADVSTPPNVLKVTIHSVNSILGDSIVVWRCWHVWGGNWKVCVLPVLLIIASAVCGFAQAVIFAEAKSIHSAFANILQRWNGSVFSLSLATNVIVTTLVAARIWFMTREIGDNPMAGRFRYTRVLLLIIESAMIYSAALVVEITLYFIGSNAFYIVYDPIAQLTGIVPTMIIVLSTLGLTSSDLGDSFGRSRRTRTGDGTHLSSMRFQTRQDATIMSVPQLGTSQSESGYSSSYPPTQGSVLDVRKVGELQFAEDK